MISYNPSFHVEGDKDRDEKIEASLVMEYVLHEKVKGLENETPPNLKPELEKMYEEQFVLLNCIIEDMIKRRMAVLEKKKVQEKNKLARAVELGRGLKE